jgi:hypothetical protein
MKPVANNMETQSMSDFGRVCVYTAIYGGYDRLKAQPEQTIKSDWLCFSDMGMDTVGEWQVVTFANPSGGLTKPRIQAKYFKIMSHHVFPGGWFDMATPDFHNNVHYDHLVWIDGSVQIYRPDFLELMLSSIGESGWALFKHPIRDCIYDEAEESALMVKYQADPILEQAALYRRIGYPAHNGLWCGGLIARRTDAHHLAAFNELWWRENTTRSSQDQISLPVVLWRLGLSVDAVPASLHNDYFGFDVGHRMEEYAKLAA